MVILAIGPQTDYKRNLYSGQSVMFDGVVSKLRDANETVSVVNISSRYNSKNVVLRGLDYLLVFLKLLCLLCFNKYDLAYVTTSQSKNGFVRDFIMIRILRVFNVKVICHQFGANYQQLLDSLGKKGKERLKNMLNYVSLIIVEGQYMKSQYSFLEHFDNKVRIIPNGLPVLGKNALKSKTYSGDEPFRMYYLSNLIWSKGYFDVLQSVNILVNKHKRNVVCIFAGKFLPSSDDERLGISSKADFDGYVKEHKLNDRVSYYPGMYGEEKNVAFSSSHVFLLPTYYINEGQPVSIIEAMAYGCVPIVTNYRHIPMMVNNDNGCFVEAKRPDQIADTIVQLMDHPEEYAAKSQACIRDYNEKFTFDKYASQVIDCMEEILKTN